MNHPLPEIVQALSHREGQVAGILGLRKAAASGQFGGFVYGGRKKETQEERREEEEREIGGK